jgi:hypothetical protein
VELRPGTRLQSVACDTQVIVVRAPAADVDLRCGGYPMEPLEGEVMHRELLTANAEGTALGKRYGDDELGIEVLCTKPGAGSLALADQSLPLKIAKPLPSSD